MYYLKNRYYDPGLRRVISSDAVGTSCESLEMLDNRNLYMYCNGNPNNRNDLEGELWVTIVSATIGAVVGGIYSVATQKVFDGEVNWVQVAGDAVVGAVSTTSIGKIGQGIVQGASAVITERSEGNGWGDSIVSGAVAAIGGYKGGPGAGYEAAYDKLYNFTFRLNRIKYSGEKLKIANRKARKDYLNDLWGKVWKEVKSYGNKTVQKLEDAVNNHYASPKKRIIGYCYTYNGRTGERSIKPIWGY